MTYQLQCEGFEQKLKNHVEASLAAAAANFSREPFTGTGGGRGRRYQPFRNSFSELYQSVAQAKLHFLP